MESWLYRHNSGININSTNKRSYSYIHCHNAVQQYAVRTVIEIYANSSFNLSIGYTAIVGKYCTLALFVDSRFTQSHGARISDRKLLSGDGDKHGATMGRAAATAIYLLINATYISYVPCLQNIILLSPMQACHAVKVAAVHDGRILDVAPHHRHVASPPGRVNRMRRVPLAHCRERCTERTTTVRQDTGTLGASATRMSV